MKASGADLLRVVHRVFFSLTLIDGVDPQAAWIALQRKTCKLLLECAIDKPSASGRISSNSDNWPYGASVPHLALAPATHLALAPATQCHPTVVVKNRF